VLLDVDVELEVELLEVELLVVDELL